MEVKMRNKTIPSLPLTLTQSDPHESRDDQKRKIRRNIFTTFWDVSYSLVVMSSWGCLSTSNSLFTFFRETFLWLPFLYMSVSQNDTGQSQDINKSTRRIWWLREKQQINESLFLGAKTTFVRYVRLRTKKWAKQKKRCIRTTSYGRKKNLLVEAFHVVAEKKNEKQLRNMWKSLPDMLIS